MFAVVESLFYKCQLGQTDLLCWSLYLYCFSICFLIIKIVALKSPIKTVDWSIYIYSSISFCFMLFQLCHQICKHLVENLLEKLKNFILVNDFMCLVIFCDLKSSLPGEHRLSKSLLVSLSIIYLLKYIVFFLTYYILKSVFVGSINLFLV